MQRYLWMATLILLGSALAQHEHHSSPAASPRNLPPVQSHSAGTNMMSEMMNHGKSASHMMLMQLSDSPFEQAFLSMMIPHHQMALEMSRYVLARGTDPQVKSWAEAILKAQEAEIAQMRQMLSNLGGTNLAAQRLMNQEMQPMMEALRKATNPDQGYLQHMVHHHLSAIDMAAMAMAKANNPAVVKLAASILASQPQEVYQFRLALAQAK